MVANHLCILAAFGLTLARSCGQDSVVAEKIWESALWLRTKSLPFFFKYIFKVYLCSLDSVSLWIITWAFGSHPHEKQSSKKLLVWMMKINMFSVSTAQQITDTPIQSSQFWPFGSKFPVTNDKNTPKRHQNGSPAIKHWAQLTPTSIVRDWFADAPELMRSCFLVPAVDIRKGYMMFFLIYRRDSADMWHFQM